MARQLKAAGQEVGLLALLDTEAPVAGRALSFRQRLRYLKNRLVEYALFVLDISPYVRDGFYLLVVRDRLRDDHPGKQMSPSEYIQWVWADALHRRLSRRAGMAELISRQASFLRMRIPTVRRVLYVLGKHIKVISRYQPGSYPGRVTLLRAGEQVKRQFYSDRYLGWRDLVDGEIDVRPISGNHVTMFKEPYVQEVAKTLRDCIEESKARNAKT
jgi:thioesterase domain-containing protein